jgi:predicted phosphodiesterase
VPRLILSDIHANLEALEAVLADAEGQYDRIICLGDLVDYGADPNAVVEWARAHVAVAVRGNHDRACAGIDSLEDYNAAAQRSAEWTRSVLSEENAGFLRNLPRGPLRYEDYDLAHGSPADEDEYLATAFEASNMLPFLQARATFFGHTHLQGGFLVTRGGVRAIAPKGTLELEPRHFFLLNPGAVGQPRDGDPRAAYAFYWAEEHRIEYRRTAYDVEKAAAKIRAAGLPDSLAVRLFHGK